MWPFKRKKNRVFQRNDTLDLEARIGPKRRQQVRAFCGAAGVALTVLMAGWTVWWGSEVIYSEWILKNDSLAIRRLDIRSDGLIPPSQLQQWARVKEGENLLAIDLHRIKRNLELIPLIENAAIERFFPGTLKIFVKERRPIAQVRAFHSTTGVEGLQPQLFYLDRFGYVLLPLQQQAEAWRRLAATIPFVTGITPDLIKPGRQITSPDLRAALELIQRFHRTPLAVSDSLEHIDIAERYALRVTTTAGSEISISPREIDGQLSRWLLVQAYGLEQQKQIASLDLAVTNYVPARWVIPAANTTTNEPIAKPPLTLPPGRRRNV